MFEGLKHEMFGTMTPEQERVQAEQEAQLGYPVPGLEQPMLDPVDAAAGGLSSLPKGIAAALADVGTDVFMGLTMDAAQNQEILKAAFIGPRGMKTLGIDAARDLAGQFSSRLDRIPRKEVADLKLNHSFGRNPDKDVWSEELLGDVTNFEGSDLQKAYPEMSALKVMPDYGIGGAFEPAKGRIEIGSGALGSDQQGTLAHETQHVIQFVEGMPRGGTPDSKEWLDYFKQLHTAKVGAALELEDIFDAYGKDLTKMPKEVADEVKYLQEGINFADDTLNKLSHDNHFENYRRLAGEAEARDVSARRKLPEDLKSRVQPFSSYDRRMGESVPPKLDELIIKY